MGKIPSLGEQEMELLKFISNHSQISVREVAMYFENEKGLARTTVLTVMERLRKKGFLKREKVDGIFKYSSKFNANEILSSKISDFVERMLGGSISPLFSYFINSMDLSKEEIQQLKILSQKIENKNKD